MLDRHECFQFFISCKRTNNANNATHFVKLGKKRRESFKRIISSRVIIKGIIIIVVITGYLNSNHFQFQRIGKPNKKLKSNAPRTRFFVKKNAPNAGFLCEKNALQAKLM